MIFTTLYFKKFFCIFLCIILLNFPVFAFSEVTEDSEILDLTEIENSILESSVSASQEPILNSRHAIVLERNSKRILYGKSEFEKTPMASTTKIATAIVVLEKEQNLNKLVSVSKKAASIRGSRVGLSQNSKITIQDLLYGLMLCSGNDAAICLAENISGSVENFVYEMNLLAKRLNLENTNFTSPHGLDDENHFTTAYDLALLTNYALSNNTFKKLVKTQSTTIYINSSPKSIRNTNELLGYCSGVYGVKTGFTNNAGRCLVTSTCRDNLDIITVVLGCDTKKFRTTDSLKLINYVFENFKIYDLSELVQKEFNFFCSDLKNTISIYKSNSIPKFKLEDTLLNFPLTNEEYINLSTSINYTSTLSPETKHNSSIGSISINIENNLLHKIDILLDNKLYYKTWNIYFFEFLKNFREICKNLIFCV